MPVPDAEIVKLAFWSHVAPGASNATPTQSVLPEILNTASPSWSHSPAPAKCTPGKRKIDGNKDPMMAMDKNTCRVTKGEADSSVLEPLSIRRNINACCV